MVKYPNEQEIIDKLIGYEIDTTKTGKPTYSNGKTTDHDDICIALGLAVLKHKEKTDMGDEPTNSIIELDMGYEEEEGDWVPMTDLSFDYGLYNN